MADPHVAVIAHVVFGNLDVAADLAGGIGQGIGDAGRGANDQIGDDLLFQERVQHTTGEISPARAAFQNQSQFHGSLSLVSLPARTRPGLLCRR